MTEECKKAIEEADLVLVGIGTQFSGNLSAIEELAEYQQILNHTEEKNRLQMQQFLQYHYLCRNQNEKIAGAYGKLAELLEGKNYFVVSLCKDDLIYESQIDRERIVTPCGGFRFLQCQNAIEENAEEKLIEAGQLVEHFSASVEECMKTGSVPELPVCPTCGEVLFFNQMGTPGYMEEGYLEQWALYTKWLQGCLNKKLVILELGAGMQYPSVIRWPFEKIGFFNQKAQFFRVHSSLYQLTEELKERGRAIASHPVDFLLSEEAEERK